MKFVLSINTNKDKSTEILPPFLLKLPYYMLNCSCAMPRAKKRSAKVNNLKNTTVLRPSRS